MVLRVSPYSMMMVLFKAATDSGSMLRSVLCFDTFDELACQDACLELERGVSGPSPVTGDWDFLLRSMTLIYLRSWLM